MTHALLPPDVIEYFSNFVPVGSRITCSPAPIDTDADWLCIRHWHVDFALMDCSLSEAGWRLGGSDISDDNALTPDAKFWSYKKGDVNLIIAETELFFTRFLAATSVAKRLNLLNKADRIALFQAVLYGNS
jgi:hypothetical protein